MNRSTALVLSTVALAPLLLGGGPEFVPGEWLVTFTDSSAWRRSLEQAPPEQYGARWEGVVDELSRAVGVPLRGGAAVGGGTWIVRVDVSRTLSSLEARVSATPGVSSVSSRAVDPGGVWGIASDRELTLRLDPGADAARVRESVLRGPVPLLPPDGRDNELALRADWGALTQRVARSLRAQPEIRAVELNEIARPLGAESKGDGGSVACAGHTSASEARLTGAPHPTSSTPTSQRSHTSSSRSRDFPSLVPRNSGT